MRQSDDVGVGQAALVQNINLKTEDISSSSQGLSCVGGPRTPGIVASTGLCMYIYHA